jgi:hypothetical protein
MSAYGPKAGHWRTSVNDLVGAGWQSRGHVEPKLLGSFDIDNQFELRGPLNRQFSGLGAFYNAIHKISHAPEHLIEVGTRRCLPPLVLMYVAY